VRALPVQQRPSKLELRVADQDFGAAEERDSAINGEADMPCRERLRFCGDIIGVAVLRVVKPPIGTSVPAARRVAAPK